MLIVEKSVLALRRFAATTLGAVSKYAMTTLNLFPTVIQLHQLDHLVEPIMAVVNSMPPLGVHSLIGGRSSWGNSGNLLDHPKLASVRAQLDQLTCEYAEQALELPPVTISNSWVNCQSAGDQVLEHRHAMSIVSAAFYIDCAPDSSSLDLHDPVEPQRQFEYNQIHRLRYSVPAVAGRLVLFPSWLSHSTRINTGPRRWAVSWNSTYCYS